MPLAKIHIVEGRYDDARIGKISDAIQAVLSATIGFGLHAAIFG